MRHLHLIEVSYTATFEELNNAVYDFINRYGHKPDLISVNHKTLKELYCCGSYQDHGLFFTYLDDGSILVNTYIGKIKLDFDLSLGGKIAMSNGQDYILVENKEAQQADNVLLGEYETSKVKKM